MRIKKIRKLYRNEWLLIEVLRFGKNYEIKQGRVLLSSPSKEEIYQGLLKHQGKNLAVEYLGKLPKEMAVLL